MTRGVAGLRLPAVLMIALILSSGCTTNYPIYRSGEPFNKSLLKEEDNVQIVLKDGSKFAMTIDDVSEEEVSGTSKGVAVDVEISSIESIELKTFSGLKTSALLAVVVLAVAAAVSDSSDDLCSSGGCVPN